MSNMSLIQCPDCGAWNDKRDRDCAQCGKLLATTGHKQDDRRNFRETHRQRKKRFDDDDGEDDGDHRR